MVSAEQLPLFIAPEIVRHQEAAAQQILAQPRGFGVAQVPPAGLRGVDPGVVEDAVVGQAHVPRIAHVHAGQPLKSGGEMHLGVRPVHHPPARAHAAARGVAVAAARARQVRILHPQEMKFAVAHQTGVLLPRAAGGWRRAAPWRRRYRPEPPERGADAWPSFYTEAPRQWPPARARFRRHWAARARADTRRAPPPAGAATRGRAAASSGRCRRSGRRGQVPCASQERRIAARSQRPPFREIARTPPPPFRHLPPGRGSPAGKSRMPPSIANGYAEPCCSRHRFEFDRRLPFEIDLLPQADNATPRRRTGGRRRMSARCSRRFRSSAGPPGLRGFGRAHRTAHPGRRRPSGS